MNIDLAEQENGCTGKKVIFTMLTWLCVFDSVITKGVPKIKDIKELSDKLTENYGKHILPTETIGPFNVTIYVSLRAVGEIDEVSEKLSTAISFYYRWNDASIRWNQTENNIYWITLGWNDVWKPILQVSNPHTDNPRKHSTHSSYETIIYDSAGNAYFDELMTARTTCDLDMTFYPFDIQSCDIEMFIVGHTEYWFNLDVSVHKDFDIADAQHGSWNLISKHITSNYGTFTIQLKFERRPLFILLNILLPIIVLAMLTPIVFVLPKKSGERVGYAITMLLAISVYMTIVSDHLPQNSQPMPLVSIMMFTWYTMDALIMFIVITNTKINTMGENKPVPYVLCKFVFLTRKFPCHGRMEVNDDSELKESQNHIEMENFDGKEEVKENKKSPHDSCKHDVSGKVTWKELSHSIDKWCFAISYLLKILIPVFFLFIISS